ncbi:MAG: hypothetical protein AAGG56_06220 [Pseudomonadota bacterium]
MAPSRSSKERLAIGFMLAWIVFWAGGMLIVLYGLVTSLLAGNTTAGILMAIWLGAAGLGLFFGVRKLRILIGSQNESSKVPSATSIGDDKTE